MVTTDREHLISEKQNNKASAEGARLPKEAMLLKDIFINIFVLVFAKSHDPNNVCIAK